MSYVGHSSIFQIEFNFLFDFQIFKMLLYSVLSEDRQSVLDIYGNNKIEKNFLMTI